MNLQDLPAIKKAQQIRDIDRLLSVWLPKAEGGDRFAVDKVIKLWERQARLVIV
jgi:hypothetical protein